MCVESKDCSEKQNKYAAAYEVIIQNLPPVKLMVMLTVPLRPIARSIKVSRISITKPFSSNTHCSFSVQFSA
jgi:hypothetical protein